MNLDRARRIPLALLFCLTPLVAHADDVTLAPRPSDIPATPVRDAYTSRPFAAQYSDRLKALLDLHAANAGGDPFPETVRMALGRLPDEQAMLGALQHIDTRHDCADFSMHGLLRLMYRFGESDMLSEGFRGLARKTILGFKYWPDEPGSDSMCYWSENHFILFSSAGYLTGQLYPDATFTNSGRTGREQMERFRPRILRWLDLRFRSGFSEWLSNVYYEEDIAAIIDLIEFSKDEEISRRASMVMDMMLLDIALNNFHGTFGCTHGRSYEHNKMSGMADSMHSTIKLFFGMNHFTVGDMDATGFALSRRYQMPQVIYDIAADLDRPEMLNRQRSGIKIDDAWRWGLDYNRLEDGMTFLTLEAYSHPKIIKLMMRMLDEYHWWDNSFFEPFAKERKMLEMANKANILPLVAWFIRKDAQRNVREEVNTYTYRTPDYMLSTAQDYRSGFGGDQQHIWQATLGVDALCFTTHPVDFNGSSPTYWTGSGVLPRSAQVKNVNITIYNASAQKSFAGKNLPFTHAWLPRGKFDEVVEQDGWIFARKGDGYLALWSQHPYHWQTEGPDKDCEVIVPGTRNIWICELGRKAVDGEFNAFMERIRRAEIAAKGLHVRYASPTQGTLDFGWRGPFKQNGKPLCLRDYARYENPYIETGFPARIVKVHCGDHTLTLNWDTLERTANAYVTDAP